MIKGVRLTNFKGFARYRITFAGDAFLVGPNNAGKSTVIAAIRAAANMIRIATGTSATGSFKVDDFEQGGHWFSGDQVGLVQENLRHEFSQAETRLRVDFSSGARLEAVWPVDEDGGFFFVLNRDQVNVTRAALMREVLPDTGIVPVLSPVEHTEELLSPGYLRRNLDGRLASRHFRNQLNLLEDQDSETDRNGYEEFLAFAAPWTPELKIQSLNLRSGAGGTSFDLLYREPESRVEKEIFWAGDGIQIWMQILLHLFRSRHRDVILLDEPDVFLHADLQRRLVDLLETLDPQTITATHSAEVVGEADPDSIIWISRNRKTALRSTSKDRLGGLSRALGTKVDMPLARALKTKVVVFVEGEDGKILKNLARVLGLPHIAKELGVTLIPLGGFSRWVDVQPFKWIIDQFLEDQVSTYVLLDRDYRSTKELDKVRRELRKCGANPHVWRRHEIENYLLNADLISRVAGGDVDQCTALLDESISELEDEFYAGVFENEALIGRKERKGDRAIAMATKARVEETWSDPTRRHLAVAGKDVLARLGLKLQNCDYNAISARLLSSQAKEDEIPTELKDVLMDIEDKSGVI